MQLYNNLLQLICNIMYNSVRHECHVYKNYVLCNHGVQRGDPLNPQRKFSFVNMRLVPAEISWTWASPLVLFWRIVVMAKPKKADKEETVTFSFRLPISVANWWNEKIAKSGLGNKSAFFRDAVQQNKTEVIAKPAAMADQKRAIFLLQKASNNLNQLAHRANWQHQAGKLSEESFNLILGQLQQLNQFMIEQASDHKK